VLLLFIELVAYAEGPECSLNTTAVDLVHVGVAAVVEIAGQEQTHVLTRIIGGILPIGFIVGIGAYEQPNG
jgi:hypothetical protein